MAPDVLELLIGDKFANSPRRFKSEVQQGSIHGMAE